MPNFKLDGATSKKPGQARMDKDENGKNMITERYLKELCEENGQYTTPALNDALYLHYKGFRKIENLESFKNIRAIWLECNGILEISGLECLQKLKMVFLQQNAIKSIQNLSGLSGLVTLNLSQNLLSKVEGLAGLKLLQTLDLSGNNIVYIDDCEEIQELPSLSHLDMKNN